MLAELQGRGRRHALHLAPHARGRGARATPPRCSATAAISRPSTRAQRSQDEIVQLMIGRDIEHQFPPKPRAHRSAAPHARRRRTSAGRTASTASRSPSARARSSASAASTARARRSCCWRCSACCAASTATSPSAAQPRIPARPAGAKSGDSRHRAGPRGSQDRRPDAADVDRRQSAGRLATTASRPGPSSTARKASKAVERRHRAAADQDRRRRATRSRRSPAATSRRSSSPNG